MQEKTKKLQILYIITKSNFGGAQRYVFDLARSLPYEKYDVLVAAGGTGGVGAPSGILFEKLHAADIQTEYLPSLSRNIGLCDEWKTFFALIQLIRKTKPDVVHLNSSKIGIVGALAARLAGVPRIVFTAHGWAFRETRNPLARFLILMASWITVMCTHKTIVLTRADELSCLRWPFAKNKIVRIPNAITPTTYFSSDEARGVLEKNFAVRCKGPVVGTIAELHANKGLDVLIQSIIEVKDVTLVIIGDGDERQKLEHYITKYNLSDRVFLTGFIPDAARLIKSFDVFVLPSRKEGFPYVILEAAHAEVPIIATTVGALREIITDASVGILVPPNNSRLLTSALSETLADLPAAHLRAQKLKTFIDTTNDFLRGMLANTEAVYRV